MRWDAIAEKYEKTDSHIVRRIRNRLGKYNKNFICCIVGDTGSGKSYAALQLALSIDPTFFISNELDAYDRLVFGEQADQFIKIINNDKKSKLVTGNAIIWDEVGRGLPKKEWYDIVNRSINKLIQSFRWKRLAVILTVPDKSYIDRDTEKLFHMVIEMDNIDFKRNISIAKPKEVQVNHLSGESYFKYPRLRDKAGRIYMMNRIEFKLPPKEVLDIYESKKQKWIKVADMNLQMKIISKRNKDVSRNIDLKSLVEDVRENYKKFLRASRYGKIGVILDPAEIMMKYKISEKLARMVKGVVEAELKEKDMLKL